MSGRSCISLEATSDEYVRVLSRASVTSICVHPSNKLALSVGADNTMRMWNLVKGRLGFVRKLKEQPFKISFSPDGSEYVIDLLYKKGMRFCIPGRAACTKWLMASKCSS